jgi:LCP family protein required for cell wall assembly
MSSPGDGKLSGHRRLPREVAVADPGAGTPPTGMLRAEIPGMGEDGGQEPPRPRRRRALKVTLIVCGVLVLIVAGSLSAVYLVSNHYMSSMKRFGNPFASIPSSARPPRPVGAAAKDVTFLVGGVDTRSQVPTTGKQAKSSARGRTDTLMLVHFIAGGRAAYVVSIPRDSWVPIPGYGDGKINWANYFGGPALAVRTVEQLTKVRVDHIAIIDWDGFRDVTNALGGVTVNVPATSYDPANHVTWTAGTHHLNGAQALLYVRDRYGLASGDFAREQRQQNYLRAVIKQLRARGTLTNPLRTSSVLRALSRAVSVDSTLSNSQMTSLALSLRRLDMSKVVFATAPNTGTGRVGSQSVVWLNRSIGRGFWRAFENDRLPAFMSAHGLKELGSSAQ